MKAAIVLEVFRRPFGSSGAAEEQEAWKALVRRRLSDADDPKLFKRCRDQIERAHDVCLSSKPDGVPVPQERRMVMTWLLYDIARESPTDEAEERSPWLFRKPEGVSRFAKAKRHGRPANEGVDDHPRQVEQ